MNLLQAIHQRWQAAAPLESLLPAARLTTGRGVDPRVPFALVLPVSQKTAGQLSDGSALVEVLVRVQIVDDDHDRAAAIAAAVRAAFDRASFALAGSDRVVLMTAVADAPEQLADGRWRWTLDFECAVHRDVPGA